MYIFNRFLRIDKQEALKEKKDFFISGIPETAEQAKDFWERDPYEFEKWIVLEVLGVPTKKTGDISKNVLLITSTTDKYIVAYIFMNFFRKKPENDHFFRNFKFFSKKSVNLLNSVAS